MHEVQRPSCKADCLRKDVEEKSIRKFNQATCLASLNLLEKVQVFQARVRMPALVPRQGGQVVEINHTRSACPRPRKKLAPAPLWPSLASFSKGTTRVQCSSSTCSTTFASTVSYRRLEARFNTAICTSTLQSSTAETFFHLPHSCSA